MRVFSGLLILIPLVVCSNLHGQISTGTIDTSEDQLSQWLAVGPIGDQAGIPINTLGASWEDNNPNWESALDYDDSEWGSVGLGSSGFFPDIWPTDGGSPAYFRRIFRSHRMTYKPACSKWPPMMTCRYI